MAGQTCYPGHKGLAPAGVHKFMFIFCIVLPVGFIHLSPVSSCISHRGCPLLPQAPELSLEQQLVALLLEKCHAPSGRTELEDVSWHLA